MSKNIQKAWVYIKLEAIMAESGTIWVKMVLSLKHGELFSEMALWLTPNARKYQRPRYAEWADPVVRGVWPLKTVAVDQ